MSAACNFDGCTVAETGRCALERDPDVCSNRVLGVAIPRFDGTQSISIASVDEGVLGGPILAAPSEVPTFPQSTTLGPDAIDQMMASRYVTVVGILGDPESGKTACLASIYLLISSGQLDGWSFADSKSLMGFEEIARGARQWNEGNPPQQMTVHTEMADERRPGFLHLRLRRMVDGRVVDLALPDIPGEWTKSLIRNAKSDRLEFLKSADIIWIVVDGRTLNVKEQLQGVITRIGQLAGRLNTLMPDGMPRILLVVTHRDGGVVSTLALDRIHTELSKHGTKVDVISVAPFSDDVAIKAGFGIAALIDATVQGGEPTHSFWPSTTPMQGARSFLSYRRFP